MSASQTPAPAAGQAETTESTPNSTVEVPDPTPVVSIAVYRYLADPKPTSIYSQRIPRDYLYPKHADITLSDDTVLRTKVVAGFLTDGGLVALDESNRTWFVPLPISDDWVYDAQTLVDFNHPNDRYAVDPDERVALASDGRLWASNIPTRAHTSVHIVTSASEDREEATRILKWRNKGEALVGLVTVEDLLHSA